MPIRAWTTRCLAAAISTKANCSVAAATVIASAPNDSSPIRVGTNASRTNPIRPRAISAASIELRPSCDQ